MSDSTWSEVATVKWFKVESDGVTLGEPFEAAPACVPLDRDGVRWFRSEDAALSVIRENLYRAIIDARSVLFEAECRLSALNKAHPL